MTLLSPLALLVALTALVPLILHLYQRRRRAVIEFSTNRFFTTAIVRSQRRLRLRRLLLLLLRVATCVLLALALARPLTSLAGFGGRPGTRDVVILLDDSLSMQAKPSDHPTTHGPRTRFEQARQLALDALAELMSGDRAAVITFTGKTIGDVIGRSETNDPGGLELSEDLLHVTREVEGLRPTFAAGDAHNALRHAAKLFQDAAPRNRLLLVLSDLQASDWRQMEWPQPLHPVSVALARVPPPPEDNLVADQMVLSQGTAVVGQPNLLRVRLLNFSPDTRPAELILHVDGKERLRRPIELPGRGPHVERIPLVFDRAGEHRLKLHVAGRDTLPVDNTLYATVRVNPQLPILLVDGHAEAPGDTGSALPALDTRALDTRAARQGRVARQGPVRRGRSAASFLRAALRAVSAEGDCVPVDTIWPSVLTPEVLAGYRVVILSEVRELSVAQVESLERFVQAGGGLAIFLGREANRAFYNDWLGAPTRPLGGLLPAELGALVESPANVAAGPLTPDFGVKGGPRTGRTTVEPLHILVADVDHPILQRFKGALRSALAGITVYRAYAARPRDAWVLASLDQDLPLLIERNYGAGRVLLCTTAPRPAWTNLPLRRAFVPLCSRIVSYLAGGGTGWHRHLARVVGEDLELLRGGFPVDRPVYVLRADGTRVRAAVKLVPSAVAGVAGAEPIAYLPGAEVKQPGFFRLEWPDAERPAGNAPTRPLAVNVPRAESSPHVLDLDAAAKLAGNWRLNVLDADSMAAVDGATATDVAAGLRPRRSLVGAGWLSRGVWDALLWTVFVLVLAEPLIANQVIRLRRNAAAGPRAGRPFPRRAA